MSAIAWPAREEARAVGVDWSGGRRAGRKIWQADLRVERGILRLTKLTRPFVEMATPPDVRAAFSAWTRTLEADVVGLDFCFALARVQIARVCAATSAPIPRSPSELGRLLLRAYASADALRAAVAPEAKRETERVVRAPFASTNLRIYRQTWLGLACLAEVPDASIAPWRTSPAPTFVEALPARVARELGCARGYKGRGAGATRDAFVARIGAVVETSAAHREVLRAHSEGDAIDAVLAALAALRAHHDDFRTPSSCVDEGWIY